LKSGVLSVAGLAIYAGEIERHWAETKYIDIKLRNLPDGFEGMRIVQLSDIHMDEYTEPLYLRHVVDTINGLEPEAVFLTGDYVSFGPLNHKFSENAAWQCANILSGLQCGQIYGVLGNHDVVVNRKEVTEALTARRVKVLDNDYVALERGGGRIWLAGLDDPLAGKPQPEMAVPEAIRNVKDEPVILLSHEPDYTDHLRKMAVGQAISLVLSGHTHGGQVRLPLVGPMVLPPMGQKYVEGLFHLDGMHVGGTQLYVNRGIGTVGVPFRLDCPPEITVLTLRKDEG